MRKELLSVFYALANLSFGLKDKYLISRLKRKNLQLLVAFLEWQKETNVAQSEKNGINLDKLAAESIELVDLLLHLKMVSLLPALVTIKHLLAFRLTIPVKEKKEKNSLPSTIKESEDKKPVEIKTDRDLDEVILTLLKYRGKCQLGEMIRALRNNFSARTIQRHLQQMINSGQIIREMIDGYPKYSIRV